MTRCSTLLPNENYFFSLSLYDPYCTIRKGLILPAPIVIYSGVPAVRFGIFTCSCVPTSKLGRLSTKALSSDV